jgi:hypothetical protein
LQFESSLMRNISVRGAKTLSAYNGDMTMETVVGTTVAVSAAWFHGLWAQDRRSLLMSTAWVLLGESAAVGARQHGARATAMRAAGLLRRGEAVQ